GQLRKRVVIAAERDAAQREKPFLGDRKHMRLHPANFVQLDSPIGQSWIDKELLEPFIADRQNFRNNKRRRFTDFREQILNLSDPRKILVIRAVLRRLQRRVVINALHFQLERLFKLEYLGQRPRRFPHSTLPVLKFWVRPLKPGKIFLPLADVGKKVRQVPLVGFGYFRACWYLG